MTETNPLPGAGMERAVEAALDEWFNKDSEIVYWRSADLSNFYRAQMRRAIAAADRARGRSYITWRKPEEYEQSPSRWVFIRRELAVDRLPPETFHTGGNLLHANVIAFAEMPAPPAWSDTLARTATDDAAPAHADLHPPSTHETPGAAVLAGGESFQEGVHKWLLACFGPKIAADKIERNHRFLEEALELVQSAGCTDSEAHQLVDYVFSRPVGEIEQEIGGVMNTLAALCLAHGFDMMAAGDKEMRRVWTMVERIRAKQAAKPKYSPLPEHHRVSSCDPIPAGRATDEWIDVKWLLGGTFHDFDEWLATRPDLTHAGTAVQLDEYNIWVTNRKSTQPHTLEDRITALEARPEWTEDKDHALAYALGNLEATQRLAGHTVRADQTRQVRNAAFPEPKL